MTRRIGVVIPFYQRDPGILTRALRSLVRQDVQAHLHVVIVDDASPVPAAAETSSLERPLTTIELVRQANTGPGGARNAGIDRLGDSVELIAFLDSDDEWRPDHLRRAVRALDAGHDVYFSNFVQVGAEVPAFERAGKLDLAACTEIDAGAGLWCFKGDMVEQIVTGNVIGTPTVVYRQARFPNHRFRTSFRWAGEDYLFWLGLAADGGRWCFGTQPTVVCGRGVNVYSGSVWGTDRHAPRLLDEYDFRVACEREFTLSPAARAHVLREKQRLAAAFRADLMHRIKHFKRIDLGLVWRYLTRR